MKDKLFRKVSVLGIIVLFIGMSVFPSTAINKVKKPLFHLVVVTHCMLVEIDTAIIVLFRKL